MPAIKREEVRQMRIKDVPIDLHRRVVAYQKILSVKKNTPVSQDEATMDLLRIAINTVPALNP